MFKTLKNKKHTPELAINYIKNQFCSKLYHVFSTEKCIFRDLLQLLVVFKM